MTAFVYPFWHHTHVDVFWTSFLISKMEFYEARVQLLNISHIYLMETIWKLSARIQQIEQNTTLSIYNDKYRTYLRYMAG